MVLKDMTEKKVVEVCWFTFDHPSECFADLVPRCQGPWTHVVLNLCLFVSIIRKMQGRLSSYHQSLRLQKKCTQNGKKSYLKEISILIYYQKMNLGQDQVTNYCDQFSLKCL